MSTVTFNRLTPYLFLTPALVIMVLALLYPLGYMVFGSFRDWDPSQSLGESEFVGFANYVSLWSDPNFRESVAVTLKFAVTVVTVEMIIGVGLALLLDRKLRGMSILRTLFILPMMIAPVVVGLIWRYMYHPTVGVFNRTLKSMGLESVDWLGQHALLSVIVADIWQWTPFIFILSLAALQSLPRSALGSGPHRWSDRLATNSLYQITTYDAGSNRDRATAIDRRIQSSGSHSGDDRGWSWLIYRNSGTAYLTHGHRIQRAWCSCCNVELLVNNVVAAHCIHAVLQPLAGASGSQGY